MPYYDEVQTLVLIFSAIIGLTTAILGYLYVFRQHVVLRPSYQFSLGLTVVLNIGGVLLLIEKPSSAVAELLFMTTLFALVASTTLFINDPVDRVCRVFLNRIECMQNQVSYTAQDKLLLSIIAIVAAIILLEYNLCVPLRRTGLWAVFFNPDDAYIAREMSLKLLNDPYIRYSYSFFRASIAPLLACLIFMMRSKNIVTRIVQWVLIGVVALSAALPGDRASAGVILLCVAAAACFAKLHRLNKETPLLAGLGVAGMLTILVVFSILRSESAAFVDMQLILQILKHRVFLAPFETGIDTVRFYNEVVSPEYTGSRILSWLTGLVYIDVPRQAGLFAGSAFDTVNMTTFSSLISWASSENMRDG
jgi:hypothetical protein